MFKSIEALSPSNVEEKVADRKRILGTVLIPVSMIGILAIIYLWGMPNFLICVFGRICP